MSFWIWAQGPAVTTLGYKNMLSPLSLLMLHPPAREGLARVARLVALSAITLSPHLLDTLLLGFPGSADAGQKQEAQEMTDLSIPHLGPNRTVRGKLLWLSTSFLCQRRKQRAPVLPAVAKATSASIHVPGKKLGGLCLQGCREGTSSPAVFPQPTKHRGQSHRF